MNRPCILVIEDEQHIASGLVFNLEAEGYRVLQCESGEEGLELLRSESVDLLVLDLMLPGISGYDVCRQLREELPRLPVLILSARAEERDRIKGLEFGADDYLTKPFSLDEFLLRVKGMLKRSGWYRPASSGEITFGSNRVDLEERLAHGNGGEIRLTDQEARLLQVFIEHEGEILQRGDLLHLAWDMDPATETRTLDNFVARLRKYFEIDPAEPQHFLTVRGRGYRFSGDAKH